MVKLFKTAIQSHCTWRQTLYIHLDWIDIKTFSWCKYVNLNTFYWLTQRQSQWVCRASSKVQVCIAFFLCIRIKQTKIIYDVWKDENHEIFRQSEYILVSKTKYHTANTGYRLIMNILMAKLGRSRAQAKQKTH